MNLLVIFFLVIFSSIAWRSPRHGVFVILATLPVYQLRFSIGPVPTTALELMIWMLFVISLLPLWKRGSWRGFVPRHIIIPTTLLFLAATIAIFVSPDTRAALGVWKAYFVDPLLFVAILLILRQRYHAIVHDITTGLAVCAAIVSLAVIIQWLTHIGIPPPWDVEGRATGLFPYPNANGLLLAPIAVLLFASPFRGEDKGGGAKLFVVFRYAVALLSLLAMVLTKSESGLIAAAVGIIISIFLPLPAPLSGASRGKIKMGVLVIALLAILLIIPTTRDKLLLRDWSGVVRRHTWSETFDMLRDRPLLGAGLSGYPIVFAPYHTTRDAIEIFQYPHNIVLNFWSETGLLGLIAFAWLSITVIARSGATKQSPETRLLHFVRNDNIAVAAKLALFTLLIHGLVDVPYFKNDLAVLFWTIIVLTFPLEKKELEGVTRVHSEA